MTVAYQFHREDLASLYLQNISKKACFKIIRLFVLLLVPVPIASLLYRNIQIQGITWFNIFVSLFISMSWFVFVVVSYNRITSRLFAKFYNNKLLEEVVLTINERRLYYRDSYGELSSDHIKGFFLQKMYFHIEINDSITILIPQKEINDVESFKYYCTQLEQV